MVLLWSVSPKKRVTAFRDKRAIIHFPTEEFLNINYSSIILTSTLNMPSFFTPPPQHKLCVMNLFLEAKNVTNLVSH